MESRRSILCTIVVLCSLTASGQMIAQGLKEVLWPGSGVLVSGELWDSFLPPNRGPYYSETSTPITGTFLRMGNFDRAWTTPTHMWPGGWPYGMFWSKGMYVCEFNPDSAWNPSILGGMANPAHHPGAGGRYALASFGTNVLGADDPSRNYAVETRWLDTLTRHHALYEAGWPTNIGIDVKVRIHQFTLNWNNFDDFILVEIVLTNRGVLDLNADGVPDTLQGGRPGLNRIHALTMMAHGEIFGMYNLNRAGTRGSRLGSARGFGYVGDPDRNGEPREMMVAFAGESRPYLRDMGLNSYPEGFYTDIWSAWSWIGVKSGEALSGAAHQLPDRSTIFGSHPIGEGAQRGWYTSAGQGRGLGIFAGGYLRNPRFLHTAAMGTWYADGGRSRDSASLDLSPDPNFFDAGIPGDPTTFVPRSAPSRPNGDRKLTQVRDVDPHETGWKTGFTGENNFDGDMFSGIGPFSLEVGETMTIVWAEAGGYQFEGVTNAMAAARWAFEHGTAVPEPPPAPAIRVENTVHQSMRVLWDDRAETHPGFSGYKIYRVVSSRKVDWLTGGMRQLDDYWRSTVSGPVPDSLLKPVNADFEAFNLAAGKTGPPDSWGPYTLVAVLPKGGLESYRVSNGWSYAWDDPGVDPGFSCWYYVAATATGPYELGNSYSGTNPSFTTTIESSNINRNGADGLWHGAYPFADLSSRFPETPDGQRLIGAGIEFTSGVSSPPDLDAGSVRVVVRPNPYKRSALWDTHANSLDHRVMFLNLPARATITIIDVAGQIVDRIDFVSPDGETGSVFWDMFSKDGIEVASGLYIFAVEYEGGKQIGYFSILR